MNDDDGGGDDDDNDNKNGDGTCTLKNPLLLPCTWPRNHRMLELPLLEERLEIRWYLVL